MIVDMPPGLTATEGIVVIAAGAAVAWLGLSWVVRRYQRDIEVPNLLEKDARIAAMFFGTGNNNNDSDDKNANNNNNTNERVLVAYDEARGAYNFQRRITAPALGAMDLPRSVNTIQRFTQQKEFAWIAVSNDRWHIGVALLQFHYIGVMVVNIFDKASKESWKQKVELPLSDVFGFGPHFEPGTNGCCAPTSAGHTIVFVHRSMLLGTTHSASIRFTGTSAAVAVSTTVATTGGVSRPVQVEFEMNVPEDHLNMVFPIGPHRASMVSKFAGAPTLGTNRLRWGNDDSQAPWINLMEMEEEAVSAPLRVGTARQRVQPLLGALDYTRGLLRRETTWYWSCLSTYATVEAPSGDPCTTAAAVAVPLGWHLSAGTYDSDVVGVNGRLSLEGTVFINGKVHLVHRPVHFLRVAAASTDKQNTEPTTTTTTQWTVSTEGGGVACKPRNDDDVQLDLTFSSSDGHLGTFNYLLVKGALLHYWGTYTGTLRVAGVAYRIQGAPGVLEDHYARW